VNITLNASGNSDCNEDTNYFLYTITSEPTYGRLSTVSGANVTYTPPTNFEGQDSFQYIGIDGVWSNTPATVYVNVTAGPILSQNCNPFGTNVLLEWTLDTNAALMSLNIQDYIVYRSTNSNGPFTAIATNDVSTDTYLDTNAVTDATYYYAVVFQGADSPSGLIVDSPLSNKIETSTQNPDNLLSSDSDWEVVTNLANTNIVTDEQAPLSSFYPNQYPGIYPFPNSHWDGGTTNLITTTFVVPTNTPLSQVQYSIAIDNDYYLYLNNTYVTNFNHGFEPTWSTFLPFPTGLLHDGTNTVHLEIIDESPPNYFSMVVTTNTCGM
jgi:Bacterial Ig domain